jgi:hypothetical protein
MVAKIELVDVKRELKRRLALICQRGHMVRCKIASFCGPAQGLAEAV